MDVGKDFRLRFRQARLGQFANKLQSVKGNGNKYIVKG